MTGDPALSTPEPLSVPIPWGLPAFRFRSRSGEPQIWKLPAAGGEAVQVTHDGGFYAEESWDGEALYYLKSH